MSRNRNSKEQSYTQNDTRKQERNISKLDESLRQVLFDIRAENSNLDKVLVKKVTMQCTKMKIHIDACYHCKINKTDHFSLILVTSVPKTDSFRS